MHVHSPSDTLVRMANDIGKFFRSQGEERALIGISNHIKLFWEPRMKKQIFAHLDEGGAGLDPLTLKALQKLKTDMRGKSTAAEAQAALAEMAEVGPDLVLDEGKVKAATAAPAQSQAKSAPQKNSKRRR
jgi:formate dehydrogenase subunit delta